MAYSLYTVVIILESVRYSQRHKTPISRYQRQSVILFDHFCLIPTQHMIVVSSHWFIIIIDHIAIRYKWAHEVSRHITKDVQAILQMQKQTHWPPSNNITMCVLYHSRDLFVPKGCVDHMTSLHTSLHAADRLRGRKGYCYFTGIQFVEGSFPYSAALLQPVCLAEVLPENGAPTLRRLSLRCTYLSLIQHLQ